MLTVVLSDHLRDWRRFCLRLGCLWGLVLAGCATPPESEPVASAVGRNRRMQLWEIDGPAARTQPGTTRPAMALPLTTRPADGGQTADQLGPPYQLNAENIIQLGVQLVRQLRLLL